MGSKLCQPLMVAFYLSACSWLKCIMSNYEGVRKSKQVLLICITHCDRFTHFCMNPEISPHRVSAMQLVICH